MAALLTLLTVAALQIITCLGSLPEEYMNVPQLIRHWGYPVEWHQVETKDGYLLTMYRIPYGRNQTGGEESTPRPPVYMLHTILSSSADWVMNLPETSLAFVLADKGFDVWLGNLRGNSYSRKHKTINPKDEKFWDFSLNEHAGVDFPACVDYIHERTNQPMYFIGHSYGSMVGFAAIDEDTSLNKKIKVFIALAPLTKLAHMSSITRTMAGMRGKLNLVMRMFGIHEFLPSLRWSRKFLTMLCRYVPSICRFGISILGGKEHKFLDKERIPVYVAHTPAGASFKSVYHILQLVDAKIFKKYDYGEDGNLKHYKTPTAPQYDIKKVKTPTVLVSGTEDPMAPPEDVAYTVKTLPFMIKHFVITGYSHMDFIWGKDSGSRLYDMLKFYMNGK